METVGNPEDGEKVASYLQAEGPRFEPATAHEPTCSGSTFRVFPAVATQPFALQMVGLFAILALLLALTGIYGVMSYAASSRAREIAIRVALGANPVDTMILLLSHGARLTMAGLVVGGVAAAGLTRVLVGILYQLSPTDPMTFTAVAAMLGVVAMAAYFVPAMKVLGIDPMEVLRHD